MPIEYRGQGPETNPAEPKRKISVVVPCFNEQEVLPQLFKRLTEAANSWGCDWEAICIDDGSQDETWRLLSQQNQRDARWKILSFARNFGHQSAVSAGLFHAVGDAVIVLDADLQDPPEVVGLFIKKWREGFDVVYAIRQKRKEGLLRKVGYWAFYRLFSRMISFSLPLDSGDFCLMDRKVVDVLNSMPERTRFVRGLRAWCGFRQIGIPYERAARAAGRPKYSLAKLFGLAFDGVFSFSTLPLVWMAIIGVWISAVALLGIVFTIATKLFPAFFERFGFPPVQGFTTIVCTVLFLGGVQLISLGVIGQYIARIYEEVKRRPPWVVGRSAGLNVHQPWLER